MARVIAPVDLRPYRDDDETAVLALLDAALGGGPAGSRPAGFFRWKHLENPFGRSYLLVAETDGRVVGLRAFMRWSFAAGGSTLRAVRAVDTATLPEHQGRGVFSALTRRALDELRDQADLVFNTPNEKSLPGYLKMGWQAVGQVPIHVRVRHPVRFLRHARSWKTDAGRGPTPGPIDAISARDALDEAEVAELVGQAERWAGIATDRTLPYLRWRYADAPLLDYRAVVGRRDGRVRSMAIFRVRPRGALVEATLAEVITRPGDVTGARRAVAAVARASRADHVACSFPVGSSARAALRSTFVRAPGGMTLVTNALGHELEPDPRSLSSWSLSVGDLEVF